MFPRYLQYLLTDFSQTFVTGASWDTDDLITFLGQKVKVQGHTIAAEAHSTRRYRHSTLPSSATFSSLQLWLLQMVCIHKSYIVYFEISVMLIGHGFSFFGHGKVMENQCWKRGGHPAPLKVEGNAAHAIIAVLLTHCGSVVAVVLVG